MNRAEKNSLGLDIGGTFIKSLILSPTGKIVGFCQVNWLRAQWNGFPHSAYAHTDSFQI